MDKKWIPFRHEDGSVLKEFVLTALALPGRNKRELLVKKIFPEKCKIWKSGRD